MNQTTRQRITGTLVLAVTALVLLPVIFDGEGSYQPTVQPEIPARPTQPQAALQDAQRPLISADSDAIRIRPETPATVIIGSDDSVTISQAAISEQEAATPDITASEPASDPTLSEPVASAAESAQTSSEPAVASAAPTATPSPASIPPASASPAAAADSASARTATLDVQGLPEGWSVRLGSFSSAENAANLVTRLQTAGHRAYTRRVESSQGVLTAVFVGPQVDRTAAQNLMERLRQDFQLNGMIVRYEIEQL